MRLTILTSMVCSSVVLRRPSQSTVTLRGQRTISAVTDSSIGRNLSNPHDGKLTALLVTADAAGAMKNEVLGIIADSLSKAGWSWGCVSTVDSYGRTIFVADAHRGDGKHFVVRADEKLTAFLELEFAIRARRKIDVEA